MKHPRTNIISYNPSASRLLISWRDYYLIAIHLFKIALLADPNEKANLITKHLINAIIDIRIQATHV